MNYTGSRTRRGALQRERALAADDACAGRVAIVIRRACLAAGTRGCPVASVRSDFARVAFVGRIRARKPGRALGAHDRLRLQGVLPSGTYLAGGGCVAVCVCLSDVAVEAALEPRIVRTRVAHDGRRRRRWWRRRRRRNHVRAEVASNVVRTG